MFIIDAISLIIITTIEYNPFARKRKTVLKISNDFTKKLDINKEYNMRQSELLQTKVKGNVRS